jgi:hypothetical protein
MLICKLNAWMVAKCHIPNCFAIFNSVLCKIFMLQVTYVFPLKPQLFVSLLQPYSPDWHVLFQHWHCQWIRILIAYLLLWQRHHYHPFSLKSLIMSTAGTFSHVYVCTWHINKDQYRFYAFLRRVTSVTLATRLKFWSPKTKFGCPGNHFSRQNWALSVGHKNKKY